MLTAEQLREWQAYDTLEGLDGTPKLELMLATLICTVVNLAKGMGKHAGKATSPDDFVPDYDGAFLKGYSEKYLADDEEIQALKQEELDRKVINTFKAMAMLNQSKEGNKDGLQ